MSNVKRVAPEGSPVVCPYLMVASVEAQMEFLVKVFNARIVEDAKRKDGYIQHGEVAIGESLLMMGRASKQFPPKESMNYVYVENVDDTHKRALLVGATELMPAEDRFYGIRESGFEDAFGNQWWIAQVIETLTKEELQKRTTQL